MRLWFKKLTVPETNETREVEAVQLWRVEWWSRHGESLGNVPKWCEPRPQVECFTSKQQATEFAEALRKAFALLKYTGTGLDVTVLKA